MKTSNIGREKNKGITAFHPAAQFIFKNTFIVGGSFGIEIDEQANKFLNFFFGKSTSGRVFKSYLGTSCFWKSF
jgi:hypothetical protein